MKHLVKRAGHSESYDSKKVYASVFAACIAVRESNPTAELIADQVTQRVDEWLEKKAEVTSGDIQREAYKHFKVLHPDASWIYLHQRNVS